MPAEAAAGIDRAAFLKAVTWSLEYLLDPKRGQGKNLPTDKELKREFAGGQNLSINQIAEWIYSKFDTNDLSRIAKDQGKIKETLDEISQELAAPKETTVPKFTAQDLAAAKAAKDRVSALGVLAKLEAIEPLLQKHRQQAQPKLAQDLLPVVKQLIPTLGVKNLGEAQLDQVAQEITVETPRQTLEDVARIQTKEQTTEVLADSLTQTLITHPEIEGKLKGTPEEIFQKVHQAIQDVAQDNQQILEEAAVLGNLTRLAKLKEQEVLELTSDQIEETAKVEAPLTPPGTLKNLESTFQSFLSEYHDQLSGQLAAFSPNKLPTLAQLQKAKEVAHNMATQSTGIKNERLFETSNISAILGLKPFSQNQIEALGLGRAQPTLFFARRAGIPGIGAGLAIAGSDSYLLKLYHAGRSSDEYTLGKDLKRLEDQIAKLKRQKPTPVISKALTQAQKQYNFLTETKNFAFKQKGAKGKGNQNLQRILQTFGLNRVSATFRQTNLALSGRFPGIWVPASIASNPRVIAHRAFGSLAFGIGSFRLSGNPLILIRQVVTTTTPGVLRLVGRFFMALGRIPYIGAIFLPIGGALIGTSKIAGAAGGSPAGAAGGIMRLAVLAKMTTPLGAAVTVGGKIARKIIKGAAALAGALLLLFGLKILGALAGLGFAAVTGLPLLLIPGVGPFLYVGWVGGWTYFGFQNPLTMLNIVAHPFSWAGNVISFVKSGFGIPSAASTVGSAIGNFFTGLASTIWGGLSAAGGAIVGFFGGAANFIVGGLGSIGLGATTASAAAIPVVGAVSAVAVGGTIVSIVTATAFFNPEGEIEIGPKPSENQFFTVTKTANHRSINNPPPTQEITFTITITVNDVDLANISLIDELKAQKESGSFTLSPTVSCPSAIPAEESRSCTFTITADQNYADSVVINTVKITATPKDQSPVTAEDTASVIIGNPPTCTQRPCGWPTTGTITLLPHSPPSHLGEVIDIANNLGTPLYSTITGQVAQVSYNDCSAEELDAKRCSRNQLAGNFIYVVGGDFGILYAHMDTIAVSLGQVSCGQKVGTMGYTGWTIPDDTPAASHLHYDFKAGGVMAPPNIPANPQVGLSVTAPPNCVP